MPTPAKLELVFKFKEKPSDVTTDKNGWKWFLLDAGNGYEAKIGLRPRMWNKIEDAVTNWPMWMGMITATMRGMQGKTIDTTEVNIQVFERKPPPRDENPLPPPQG